jgi:hypothetical protein
MPTRLALLLLVMILAPVALGEVRSSPLFSEPLLRSWQQQADADPDAWGGVREAAAATIDPASPRHVSRGGIDASRGTFLRDLDERLDQVGMVYLLTGDVEAGAYGARVVADLAVSFPIDHDRIAINKVLPGYRGDLARTLAMGLAWFEDAMTPKQREDVRAALVAVVEQLRMEFEGGSINGPYHNFNSVCMSAVGLAALVMDDHPDAEVWLAKSRGVVVRWLDKAIDEDGAFIEGTSYVGYGTDSLFILERALRDRGLPSLIAGSRLKKLSTYYAMSLLPGEGVFDARNDAHYSSVGRPNLRQLAWAFDDGLALWLAENTQGPYPLDWRKIAYVPDVEAVPPGEAGLPLAKHFRGRGLAIFRTGWAADDLMFSIEAGPYYKVTHNQADKGHFSLYGNGGRWAIDSAYAEFPSHAHSVPLIDGRGQALSGYSYGTSGTLYNFTDGDRFGYVRADMTSAYLANDVGVPGVDLKRAVRHAVFVRPSGGVPGYVIMHDDLDVDGQPHRFAWLMQTASNMTMSGDVLTPEPAFGGEFVEPYTIGSAVNLAWELDESMEGECTMWARVRAIRGPDDLLTREGQIGLRVDGKQVLRWKPQTNAQWDWIWLPLRDVADRPDPLPDDLMGRDQLHDAVLDPSHGPTFANSWHTMSRATRYHLPRTYHATRVTLPDAGEMALTINGLLALDAIAIVPDNEHRPPAGPDDERVQVWLEAESTTMTTGAAIQSVPSPDSQLHLQIVAAGELTAHHDYHKLHPRLWREVDAVAPEFTAVLVVDGVGSTPPTVEQKQVDEETVTTITINGRTDVFRFPVDGPATVKLGGS